MGVRVRTPVAGLSLRPPPCSHHHRRAGQAAPSSPFSEAYEEEADAADAGGDYARGNTYAWLLASGYNPDTEGHDRHGAGSIVFDTKAEEVSDGTPLGVVYHLARLVRYGYVTETPEGDPTTVDPDRVVVFEDGETDRGRGGDGGGQSPDLAAAAAALGLAEGDLMEALGVSDEAPGGAPPEA